MTLRKIVYICSSGRSGSTLLDMLLGSHPGMVSLGEIEHLPKNLTLNTLCSCGAPARECEFWARVLDDLAAQGIDVRAAPYAFPLGMFRASRVIDKQRQTPTYLLRRRLVLSAKLIELRYGLRVLPSIATREYERGIDNSLQLYDSVARVAGAFGVIDSSKEYRRAVSLYQRDPERVRILVLVRDGRGVFSAMRRSGNTAARSLAFWARYYRHAMPVITQHVAAEHRMVLRYEDLVARPSETLQGVCIFLGVDFASQMLDFRREVKHVLNGNDMRSAGASALVLDERWRRELRAEDLRYFEKHGGTALNLTLGYQ